MNKDLINILKNKKFAIMLGGGVDGCGVTHAALEIQNWCDKNNIPLKIYSYDEYKFATCRTQSISVTSFKQDDIDSLIKEFNSYDVIMFHSFPSKKYSHDAILKFYDMVKKLTCIKVGFMHNPTKTSINIVPNIVLLANEMDLWYTFSLKTFFAQQTIKMMPSKKNRIKKLNLWFDFDKLQKYYNNTNRNNKLIYIGRFATFKDTQRTLYLGKELLNLDNNFKTEMHGIDTSMGAKINILDHPYCINHINKKKLPGEEACIDIYGAYKYDDAMEILSNNLFGCSFFNMKNPDDYGDRLEYTQMEIIACGCIPIFDEDWSKHNHTLNGQLYSDIPYFGIYCTRDNLKETAQYILNLSKNKELIQKYRDTSIKIAKENFDINLILPNMLNDMINSTTDNDKFKNENDLLMYINNSNDYLEEYSKQSNNDNIVITNYSTLPGRALFILDGHKKQKIKTCKKNK